ncbi:CotD family spore coat protein [Shouchella tritolerans]|uniref:CotD family spore coat protein n=1 Tax=Shouchella tritolerans TaxID=2979466 RepID=UPI000786DD01|nr:CotD family spore coat protein [Shouchella tritolerans]
MFPFRQGGKAYMPATRPLPPAPRPVVHEYIVQEIQPVLTTYVTNRVYRHVHTFPHSASVANVVQNQQAFPPTHYVPGRPPR